MTAIGNFLYGALWGGWRRWATWAACIGMLLLLGIFRTETDAEFTFASLAIFPVLVIAWMGGKLHGLFMAFLGVAMWVAADYISGRQFSASWVPWVNAATHFATYGLVAVLAAQVRLQFEREHEHATRDALTGLQNRRSFLAGGASEVERSKRYGHPLSVIFLDLDDFKQLNDTRGHDAGDAALRETARALRNALRSNDRVARLGGDEFVVLLPEVGFDEAIEAGRKVSVAVNEALRKFSPVTCSVGVAWFEQVAQTFPEMLKAADALMYEVKEGGKNNMHCRRFAANAR